jgi:hypothetical protein
VSQGKAEAVLVSMGSAGALAGHQGRDHPDRLAHRTHPQQGGCGRQHGGRRGPGAEQGLRSAQGRPLRRGHGGRRRHDAGLRALPPPGCRSPLPEDGGSELIHHLQRFAGPRYRSSQALLSRMMSRLSGTWPPSNTLSALSGSGVPPPPHRCPELPPIPPSRCRAVSLGATEPEPGEILSAPEPRQQTSREATNPCQP